MNLFIASQGKESRIESEDDVNFHFTKEWKQNAPVSNIDTMNFSNCLRRESLKGERIRTCILVHTRTLRIMSH